MRSDRRARGAALAAVFAVLSVLGGVVVSTTPKCHADCQVIGAAHDAPTAQSPDAATTATTPPASRPASLAIVPAASSTAINPAAPVLVRADAGTITDVVMANDAGTVIPGALTPDHRVWKPTGQLGYGREYTMTVTARGPRGMPSRQTSSFTTLEADNLARVYFENTAGNLLQDGGTYGVGAIVVASSTSPSTTRPAPSGTSTSPPTLRSTGRGTGSTTGRRTGGPPPTTPQAPR